MLSQVTVGCRLRQLAVAFLLVVVCMAEIGCGRPRSVPTLTSLQVTPDVTTTVSQTPDGQPVVIEHRCADISKVPLEWITRAKSGLRVLYFHSSHGDQVTVGMTNLQERLGSLYAFSESGADGALTYQEVWDDLGTSGNVSWADTTRKRLTEPGNVVNVVVWSWCGGVSENTKEGIDAYLAAMSHLEADYPDVKFVYMTGHLDGTGEPGNLNVRNDQIRSWCIANGKTLFDFADIESYDPDGKYFLNRGADADCSYDGGNWAEEWVRAHPDSAIAGSGYFEHTHVLNCNIKGSAFWWMLARIAGWPGQ